MYGSAVLRLLVLAEGLRTATLFLGAYYLELVWETFSSSFEGQARPHPVPHKYVEAAGCGAEIGVDDGNFWQNLVPRFSGGLFTNPFPAAGTIPH